MRISISGSPEVEIKNANSEWSENFMEEWHLSSALKVGKNFIGMVGGPGVYSSGKILQAESS